jgi:hypothetical protein
MNGSYKSKFGSSVFNYSLPCKKINVEWGFDRWIEVLFVDILISAT